MDALHMREVNKTALQRELQLPTHRDLPLLSMVTRLDPVKGLDLVVPALEALMHSALYQFVILGTGREDYAHELRSFQQCYPRNVRFINRFDERLARRIYGGSDFFLMPSREEAISTSVMIAMRYGSVPVVRATGGLCDVVIDTTRQPERGTGFDFQPFSAEALTRVLETAIGYRETERWFPLQRRVMKRNFSWAVAAHSYLDIYRRSVQIRMEKRV
jgi:starch synthase